MKSRILTLEYLPMPDVLAEAENAEWKSYRKSAREHFWPNFDGKRLKIKEYQSSFLTTFFNFSHDSFHSNFN